MNLRKLGLTIAAGIATVLVVGVAVTELLQPRIEFSLLVGIPAGLFAGAVVAAVVAWSVGEGRSAQQRRLAVALGSFAAAFLAVLVAGALLSVGTVLGTVAGVAVGLVAALGAYLRGGGSPPERTTDSPSN